MGLPDTSLTDLVVKVKSWISWRGSDLTPSSFSAAFEMPDNDLKMCSDCNSSFSGFLNGFNCQGCGRWLCFNCADGDESGFDVIESKRDSLKSCKFCKFGVKSQGGRKNNEKVHPTESPRHSPEPPSPCFSVDYSDRHPHYLESKDYGFSSIGVTSWSASSFSPHRSSLSLHHSPSRSDEEEAEESGNHFYSPSSEYCHDMSDIDSSSLSARFELYNCKSVGSSPLDSPSRIDFNSYRAGHFVQQGQERKQLSLNDGSFGQENSAILRRPDKGTEDPQHTDDYSCNNQYDKAQKLLDFESNGRIWLPPPPEDENDEAESNLFAYDDDDDDIGDSGAIFSSTSSLSAMFPLKEKQNECNKEPLKAVIQGHFRALVSQLIQGEGIKTSKEDNDDDWLDIVTTIALQAANFVKPDTRRGGSMDPVDYVKVKCIASGSPSDSTLVKGVVCTKNIKHKRMTTQYRHPRLLLLGGALENQSVVNHLASFNTLVQQENDHLKMIIAKIEALRPNVLLVEKSVSPYAQEYLLAKDISLVLNVKRPLLERIAQCTGAFISPSIDNISTTRLGNCELFRVERVVEEHEATNQFNRKPSKTLMFFEGCPRRLGCTVLLRGSCREELKKVKHVVQYAVFAAYHLSLETSFLADEGATLPKMTLKPSISNPEPDTVIDEGPANLKPEHEDLLTNLSPFLPNSTDCTSENTFSDVFHDDQLESFAEEEVQVRRSHESAKSGKNDEDEISSEYFSATDTNQSILVSFSSRCVLKGTICERSRLLRIKFYGSFDKPLGRYLRDDLFDKTSYCGSCKEPAEAHVLCYTHQQGNLTINVRSLSSVKLPGEKDGKIWMWHRCLRCAHIDGVPPPTLRVVMSDAAWGLSFGKFLELSFSNHATANRVAPCGHSLQRDCLRFYGFGSMVAFFRYSPIDILSVHLPPPVLEFNCHVQQDWIKKEADELLGNMETFYSEISDALESMEEKSKCVGSEMSDLNELQNHIMELKDQLRMEQNDYCGVLQVAVEGTSLVDQRSLDILELNNLRRALIIGSHVWDRQLYSLDSLLKTNSVVKAIHGEKELRTVTSAIKDLKLDHGKNDLSPETKKDDEHLPNGEITDLPSKSSSLSDRIDSAWSGTDQPMTSIQPPFKRLLAPVRVNSFDSALRVQDRIQKGLPPSSLYLSTLKSFHASGDYRSMVRDPVPRAMRTYSQTLPMEGQKLNLMHSSAAPSIISSASQITGGARLLLPKRTPNDIVIGVFDNDPASIVSYALCSKEHDDWVSDKPSENDALCSGNSTLSAWQSFGSSDLEYIRSGSFVSEDPSPSISTLSKKSPHLTISFADDGGSKVKFSVTCYFAKEFEALRKKCCPSEVDFIRSLSRCERWNAQGGKSNVYFAKSLDERFILKQVKKTELDSFEEFASDYFKYLTDSLSSGSPTCLAKVLGIYQVSVKHLKGGKEMKMDVIVMENLFYQRNISRVYDLKGSSRSRYNPDTTGANKVLLDSNLVETLRMEPLFLGSKAKRSLERAIWNDTSFLASVDVMDYSLLVGIDNERKELVLGIIDFMRQYTWDKHLETWVKATGILGGPKNASPTIISPKQYKKRFRKAMTSYFLTVPDQWSS